MSAKFGVGGNPLEFYEQGYISSLEMPKWLKNYGLDTYEYQCSNGIRISEQTAIELGKLIKANNILLSTHSPYYINLSSMEFERINKTLDYIINTAKVTSLMNGNRIVIHMGSFKGTTRQNAVEISKQTLLTALERLQNMGLNNILLCIETMGKINQMGTVEEVAEVCSIHKNLIPTLDFGHINARKQGSLKKVEDYLRIFDTVGEKIGADKLQKFHCHFSRIEFSSGGEKKHYRFCDTQFGPDYEPFIEAIKLRNLEPVIICESAGTQAIDALIMKNKYFEND